MYFFFLTKVLVVRADSLPGHFYSRRRTLDTQLHRGVQKMPSAWLYSLLVYQHEWPIEESAN